MSCYGEERAALASVLQELLNPAAALMLCISICTDPKSHGMNLPLKQRVLMYFACFSIVNGLMN